MGMTILAFSASPTRRRLTSATSQSPPSWVTYLSLGLNLLAPTLALLLGGAIYILLLRRLRRRPKSTVSSSPNIKDAGSATSHSAQITKRSWDDLKSLIHSLPSSKRTSPVSKNRRDLTRLSGTPYFLLPLSHLPIDLF